MWCLRSSVPAHTRWATLQFILLVGSLATSLHGNQNIVVRSGNGSIGSKDTLVRVLPLGGGNITPSPTTFLTVQTSQFADIVPPNGAYISTLPSDPAAKWIATSPGRAPQSALYAFPFQITDSSISSANLDIHYSVDNAINGVFINGTPISGNSYDGDYHAEYRFVRSDIAPLLRPNAINWLYLNLADYGGDAALVFNVAITTVGGGAAQPVAPSQGGNAGAATVKISGSGFPPARIAVTLRSPGQLDIAGKAPLVISSSEIRATFNLRGAPTGPRDVVVTSGGQTILSLPNAFTVVSGGTPQLSVNVVGPSRIRAGSEANFDIVVSNTGLIDAEFTQVQVDQQAAARLVPLMSDSVQSRAAVAGLTCSGFDNLTSLRIGAGGSRTLSGTCIPSGAACYTLAPTVTEDDSQDEDPCEEERQLVADLQQLLARFRFDLQLLESAYRVQEILYQAFGCSTVTAINAAICTLIDNEKSRLLNERAIVRAVIDLITAELAQAQADLAICEALNRRQSSDARGAAVTRSAAQVSSPTSNTMTFCGVTSLDPNTKLGVIGAGPQQHVRANTPFGYTVQFENLRTAAASAVNVTVSDPLSPSLDTSTVDVRSITFGKITLQLPPRTQQYSTIVDLRPQQNALVKVSLALVNGNLNLTLATLDPATLKPPSDPSIGVLPPNIFPPAGEGSFYFTVAPRSNLPTGTQITNQASIVFDTNAPILTPVWLNTIDNTKPVSKVAALPATQTSPTFTVQWSGTDLGAGVKDYTIYASDNGGPFFPVLQSTTATQGTYKGVAGHTYRFYSIARDLTGNVEGEKTVAEATTTLVDSRPPTLAVTLSPNLLWPPNHQLIVVNANVQVSDDFDPNTRVALVSITSSEPDNGLGDGDTANDIQGAALGSDDRSFMLRAERSANGSGRTYIVTYRATDSSGNMVTTSVPVTVPLNRGN